jgi:hypothetical protein
MSHVSCLVSSRLVSSRLVSSRLVSSRLIVSYRIVSYRIVSYLIVSYRISYRINCKPRETLTGLGPRSRKRESFFSCCMDVLGYIVEESEATGQVFKRKFAKLQRLLASSCRSVPPCSWNSSLPTERIFMKICCLSISRKPVVKIQISLKFERNNGHFTQRPKYFYDHILLSSS